MRNHPYIIVMDDGKRFRLEALSAGEAIEKARWLHREHLVLTCYQGADGQDFKYPGGVLYFDVPEHSAVSKDAIQPKQAWRRQDDTETFGFFNNITLTNDPT